MPFLKIALLIPFLVLVDAAPHQCDKIDPTNVDWDGMPFCPDVVTSSPQGAWAVFSCAVDEARSWTPPTSEQRLLTQDMLQNYQISTQQGIAKATTGRILADANALGLQACRVKSQRNLHGESLLDSYLLIYTQEGNTAYNGALFGLRESNSSRFVIYSPHDDSDGTFAATKLGFQKTFARALISNGHKRGVISHGNIDLYRESDFVHSTINLGFDAVVMLANMFPGSVSILFNGIKNPDKSMVHSRSPIMQEAFETALTTNSHLKSDDFTGYSPSFSIDTIVKTDFYIKCEIPSVIYMTNYEIVADIAEEMETYDWDWPLDSILLP